MIGEMFSEMFRFFFEFSEIFSFVRSCEMFSKNRSRRDDSFGPKVVEIGAILAMFQTFELFQQKNPLPWTVNHIL